MQIVGYQERHFAEVDLLWRACFPDDPERNRAEHSIPSKQSIGKRLGSDLFLVAESEAGSVIGTIMAGYDGHRGWGGGHASRSSMQSPTQSRLLKSEFADTCRQ